MKTIFLSTDDEAEFREIDNELEALQAAVGGNIEVVHLPTDSDLMIVDEEGRLKDKPINRVASVLARQTIVGDALLVSEQGEDFGDADPMLLTLARRFIRSLRGSQLSKYRQVVIAMDETPGASKRFELATRSFSKTDSETIAEMQQMISVCTNELLKGVHIHKDDLFMYCIALSNIIESLEQAMDSEQKETYALLKAKSSLTTFIKR